MRPVVNGLEAAYGDRIDFRGYNIVTEEGQAWAKQYQLRGHPAFVLVNSAGEEQWSYTGVVSAEAMEAALNETLPAGE